MSNSTPGGEAWSEQKSNLASGTLTPSQPSAAGPLTPSPHTPAAQAGSGCQSRNKSPASTGSRGTKQQAAASAKPSAADVKLAMTAKKVALLRSLIELYGLRFPNLFEFQGLVNQSGMAIKDWIAAAPDVSF